MTYQKDATAFVQRISRESSNRDADIIADEILELANKVQRYAVMACNWGLSPRQERNEEKVCEQIRQRCHSLGEGFAPVFQGDPRGCCVKLKVPSGYTDDWGQTGLCVPTRRY
jgi:hypothetical protein